MEKRPFCKCKHSCVFAFDGIDSNTEPDLEDPIQLFCRIKPMRYNLDTARIAMVATRLLSFIRLPENNVFTIRSTQKEIFHRVAYPLLQDLMKGLNSSLFFYGTSESGKSHTLIGDQADPGILPRIIDTLFNTITNYHAKKYIIKSDRFNGFIVQSDKVAAQIRDTEHKLTAKFKVSSGGDGKKKRFYHNDGVVVDGVNSGSLYAVFVSFILIYNESVYDLLDQSNGKVMQNKVLKLDIHQKICVENLVELEVMTSNQAHELFIYGYKRKRSFLDEKGNEEWKKAHSIFNIRLVQLPKKYKQTWNAQDQLITSQLSLVDLASVATDQCDEDLLQTSQTENSVNNSILSLRICMQIYRNNYFCNTKTSIPYGDSKLTLFFKDYFDGEGSLRVIICVNPSIQYYDEASQAMLFANIDQRFAPDNCECIHIYPGTSSSETPSTSKQTSLAPKEAKSSVVMENFENVEASDAVVTRLIKILNVNKHSRLASMCEMKHIESFRKRLTEIKRQNIAERKNKRYVQRKLKKIVKEECDCDSDEKLLSDSDQVEINQCTSASEFWKQNMEEQLNERANEYLKSQSKKLNVLSREEKRKVQKIKGILKNDDLESVQNGINEKLEVIKGNQERDK